MTDTNIFNSEILGGVGTVAPNMNIFLSGQKWKHLKPNIPMALWALTFLSIILVSTLFVRIKQGPLSSSTAKFKNCLKNINVLLSMVWLTFLLINISHRLLAYYGIPLPFFLPNNETGTKGRGEMA